jgi:hypothetical protein
MGPHLLGAQAVDVRLAGLDELHGVVVQLLEVVGRVEELVLPVEAEPAHILLDRFDVLDVFFRRVGVVEAQMTRTAVFQRNAEVQADRLGMADVEIAVRFGRETRRHPTAVFVGGEVPGDDVADEVARRAGRVLVHAHRVSASGTSSGRAGGGRVYATVRARNAGRPGEQCNLAGERGTCTSTAAPAPTMTPRALLVGLILLAGTAAWAIRRRQS